ncbi:MAG: hypothetical protein R2844_05280 [Caldilineales bacterium]
MNSLRDALSRGHRRHLVALAIFAALALLMTYPLALQAAHSIGNYGDPLLNTWALASNAHKFVTNPLDLFNANIFYPYPATLAYSENLIGISALTAPLIWATDNPVLVHNLALLFSFPLSRSAPTCWCWISPEAGTVEWSRALPMALHTFALAS